MTTESFAGSCLCGAQKYEVDGEPGNFFHCHCSRCRKATGTGHCSNLFVKTDGIRWDGDERLRKSYKVPEAQFFTTDFCAVCGSNLPRFLERAGLVLIPAGSLDSAHEIEANARIYYDSRTSWSCSGDDTPCVAEAPQR